MTINNATTQVTATKSGTGWTLDVTACNLSTDLSIKDFVVYFNDVLVDNANFTKTSAVTLTYTGSSISSTAVKAQRDTPITRVQEVLYGDRFASSLWENELNRVHKILTEIDQFGTGVGVAADASTTVAHVQNMAALQAIPVPSIGTVPIYFMRGYYTPGDGGGGFFYWDSTDTTTTADDGLVVLVNSVSGNGRWKRILPEGNELNVKWFGAKGDLSQDDQPFIQKAINTTYGKVFIPGGQYKLNSPLDVTSTVTSYGAVTTFRYGITIRGENAGNISSAGSTRLTRLYGNAGDGKAIIETTGSSQLVLQDLALLNATMATPSTIGLLNCRGAAGASPWNHVNRYENIFIDLADSATQNSSTGSIGVWHFASENTQYHHCEIRANLPLVVTSYVDPALSTAFIPTPTYAAKNASTSSCLDNLFAECIFSSYNNRQPHIWANRAGQLEFRKCYWNVSTPTAGNANRVVIKLIFTINTKIQGLMELPGSDGGTPRLGMIPIECYGYNYGLIVHVMHGTVGTAMDAGVNYPWIKFTTTGAGGNGGIMDGDIKFYTDPSLTAIVDPCMELSADVFASNNAEIRNCNFTLPAATGVPTSLIDPTYPRFYDNRLIPTGVFPASRYARRYGSQELQDEGRQQARLTVSSTDPDISNPVTSVTNALYILPFKGRRVSLRRATAYGSVYEDASLGDNGITIDTSVLTDNTMYDVFLYWSSFVFGTISYECVAWSTSSSRGYSLNRSAGTYYKDANLDRKYIGTFYLSTGKVVYAEKTSSDGANKTRYHLYNHYNQQVVTLDRNFSANYTYATATWRECNAAVTGIDFVNGSGMRVVGGAIVTAGANATTCSYRMGIQTSVAAPAKHSLKHVGTSGTHYSTISNYHNYAAASGLNTQYLVEYVGSGTATVNVNGSPGGFAHNVTIEA